MKCPECSGNTIEQTTGAQMQIEKFPFVEIKIVCCVECDWMTVDDWNRYQFRDWNWIG